MKNKLIKATALLGCSCGVVPVLAQPKEKPNIIFILADDHARAAISAYGGINAELAPTPNIDKIGAEGVKFSNMLCTNAISGPSRASLLTGKYSTSHGFYQNEGGIVFDNTQQTFPQLLHQEGYQTALVGKWHLYSEPKGFDYYKIHANPGQQGTYWNPLYSTNGAKPIAEKGYATKLSTDASIAWMNEAKEKNKPFCLLLHYKAPHRPWQPDSIYLDLFNEVEFPYPATFNDDYHSREKTAGQAMMTIENHLSRGDLKQAPPSGLSKKERNKWLWYGGSGKDQHWKPSPSMSQEESKKWKFQTYLKNYLRCVRSVDDHVGRVLDFLKENKLEQNTIVIYMGDQGFFLGEHGFYDKRWMYEEAIQMPLLVRYPKGIKTPVEVDALTLNIDVMPTILDYAGVKPPADVQGKSLKKLMENNAKAKRKWRKSAYYQYFEYPKWHQVQPHYGLRTAQYKLIHFYYNINQWEFYDLANDPNELTNSIDNPRYAKVIAELKKELRKLQKECQDDKSLEERRELTNRYMLKYDE